MVAVLDVAPVFFADHQRLTVDDGEILSISLLN
jgi:hypothetical protein